MKSPYKHTIALLILPITIISNQGGVTMQNSVTTTGNSEVYVESNTNQSSNNTVNVSQNSVTTNNTGSKTNTKMEITVNGKTKKLETEEPGVHILEFNETVTSEGAKIDLTKVKNNNQMTFPGKKISLHEYIKSRIENFFKTFFWPSQKESSSS